MTKVADEHISEINKFSNDTKSEIKTAGAETISEIKTFSETFESSCSNKAMHLIGLFQSVQQH